MRLPCAMLLCAVSLATASAAFASHVPPVLPLTSGSNHEHEELSGMAFPSANLSAINLAFADLKNSSFAAGTDLSIADFTGADLTNCNLSGCNIQNAFFRGANLTNAVIPCTNGADFRGAILTGATVAASCTQCNLPVFPNLRDPCTVGSPAGLCFVIGASCTVISGVVFVDANSNGTLDFGETGISGVQLTVNPGIGPTGASTDSRGVYGLVLDAFVASRAAPAIGAAAAAAPMISTARTIVGPGSVALNTATLPSGMTLTGPSVQNFDTSNCRSAQALNFPVHDNHTATGKSTFGRLKMLYR